MGLIAGVGLVFGKPVCGASYDESVLGGTQSDRNRRKMAKLLYLAVEHRWPFVCFVNGAGARLDDPRPGPPIAISPRGTFRTLRRSGGTERLGTDGRHRERPIG